MRTDVVSELAGLRALARSLVRGDADADDLIQDTAVRMLEHPPELDRPVRPWLVTVMLNRWRMDRRSEARRRARELATATPEPEVADPRERAQTLRKLGEAVEALPEPYRNLVIARYFDGKSSVDLAAELGIPAVTVRTRLLRALEKLRKALDEGAPRKKWMRALVPVQGGWLLGGKATTALTLFLFVMMMGGGVWYAWPRAHTSSPAAATAGGQTMTPIRILRAAAAPALAAADPTPGQGRATIDEADIPGGAAAGRVINWSTGEGVAGAELTFTSDAGAVTVKSGDDGAFELATGSPGAFALTQVGALGYLPYAPEYLHSTVHFRLEAGRAVRGLSVFLFPALDYNGRVVDTSGAPVAGARVTLAGSGETSIDRVEASWTTDRDGRFLFHAADMAVLEATAGDRHGWSNVDSGVQITKQMVITVAKVPAHDATITGRVVDEAGKPVADVLVGAYPQHDPKEMMDKKPARPQAFAVSDASGAFELRGLDRDKYELKAEHRDRAPTTQKDIVGGTHGITLAISFGVQLDGAVVSADGAAIPAFTLLVFQRDGVARNLITTRSLVDVAGHFSVRVPPGRYELQAAAAGWAPSAMTGVNAPSTGVKLAVSLGATVRGRVVSAADGTPLAQARVMREGMYGGASALPSNSGTVTRADGTFELRGIPAGTAAITVVTDNFHPRIESGLVATDGGELGPLDLPLTPLAPGAEPKTDYVGIGISTAIDGDDLLIQKVIPGGGAQAAGVVDGDRIVSIDGVPVTELGEVGAVTRIRGLPNTTLALGLRRGGSVVTLIVTRSRLQA